MEFTVGFYDSQGLYMEFTMAPRVERGFERAASELSVHSGRFAPRAALFVVLAVFPAM